MCVCVHLTGGCDVMCFCVSVCDCVPNCLRRAVLLHPALAAHKCQFVPCRLPGSMSRLSEHANLMRGHIVMKLMRICSLCIYIHHNSNPYYVRFILEIINYILSIAVVMKLLSGWHSFVMKRLTLVCEEGRFLCCVDFLSFLRDYFFLLFPLAHKFTFSKRNWSTDRGADLKVSRVLVKRPRTFFFSALMKSRYCCSFDWHWNSLKYHLECDHCRKLSSCWINNESVLKPWKQSKCQWVTEVYTELSQNIVPC